MQQRTVLGGMALLVVVFGLMVVALRWFEVFGPEVVEEEVDGLKCRDYITPEQCQVLQQMPNPDDANLLMEAMDPENVIEVADPVVPTGVAEVHFGEFNPPRDAIHNAQGQARVFFMVSQGQATSLYIVRLDGREEPFEVTNAPDLRIYLSKHANPVTTRDVFVEGAYEVGRLKGNRGPQNYGLSTDIDVSQFQSVVLYSPLLDQIFGVARLE